MKKPKWQPPHITHGTPTIYNWVVLNPHKLLLGTNTDIGAFTLIQALNGVVIDDDVQIGSHCSIYSESTIDNKSGAIRIGKGAKIGSHSTIMPGVTVGEGAVVGAHSFVNCDVPAGVTAFGTPIKRYWKEGVDIR